MAPNASCNVEPSEEEKTLKQILANFARKDQSVFLGNQ